MVASPNPPFITGQVTATVGGVSFPVETIRPAPGLAGLVTVTVTGTGTATLTAPGCTSGLNVPAGSPPLALMLGGSKLVATSAGSPVVSYGYATGG